MMFRPLSSIFESVSMLPLDRMILLCSVGDCRPCLSEPGAVEHGERAEAGRRGSSGALQCAAHQAGRWRATRQVALIAKVPPNLSPN